jgi:hypothetical protein
MAKVLIATSNVFISLVLGALLMALVFLKAPYTFEAMLGWATRAKSALTSTGLDTTYNNFIRLVLEERQLLFMFFTIAARLAMATIAALFMWLLELVLVRR